MFPQRECLCAAHRLSLVTNVVLTGFTHWHVCCTAGSPARGLRCTRVGSWQSPLNTGVYDAWAGTPAAAGQPGGWPQMPAVSSHCSETLDTRGCDLRHLPLIPPAVCFPVSAAQTQRDSEWTLLIIYVETRQTWQILSLCFTELVLGGRWAADVLLLEVFHVQLIIWNFAFLCHFRTEMFHELLPNMWFRSPQWFSCGP